MEPTRSSAATHAPIDWGRMAQLMKVEPQEPSAAVPDVLSRSGQSLDDVVFIEHRSPAGPLYLPPMSRYSVVTRLDDVAKVMSWGGCTVEHKHRRHETFIVPPFQHSYFCSSAPTLSIGVTLAPSLFTRLAREQGRAPPGLINSYGSADTVLCGLALAALTHVRGRNQRSSGFLRCIGEAVALHLLEQHAAVPAPAPGRIAPAQLTRVLDYVHDHFAEPVPVSRLAELLDMSPTQFSRAFKATRGESPLRWMQRLRMERARELVVGTQRSITSIAAEVGYDDLPHFSRLFTRHWGCAASALRRTPAHDPGC